MDCAACHSAWTNTCMGCHLEGEYDEGDNFSNITGERIVFRERNADFVYQSPLFFQLGVDPTGKITQFSSNTKTFFQYRDRKNVDSEVFTFSDRNGAGSNPAVVTPSLSHNAMMAHSIRGKVDMEGKNEGPRYCAACHLTESGLEEFGEEYDDFRSAIAGGNWGALDFPLLEEHFGRNTGNRLNSPLFVHMVAGLGSGLFLFDEHGCPVNLLDDNPDRAGCDGNAPKFNFDPLNVAYHLDRIVEETGVSNGSNNHPMLDTANGPELRFGALDADLSGPCLLYTSPSPRDGLLSRMPSSA